MALTICNANKPSSTRHGTEPAGGDFGTFSPYGAEGCDIWVYPLGPGQPVNLTEGAGNNWAPVWSPDGQNLAFFSDRDGAAKLWLWAAATSSVRLVSDTAVKVSFGRKDAPQWISTSRILVKIPRVGGAEPPAPEHQEAKSGNAPVEVLTSKADGGVRDAQSDNAMSVFSVGDERWHGGDLGIVDLGSGEVTRIGGRPLTVQYVLSPDGSRLAYLQIEPRDMHTGYVPLSLRLLDIRRDKVIRTVEGLQTRDWRVGLAWSPDGRNLAFTSYDFSKRADASRAPGETFSRGNRNDGVTVDVFLMRDAGVPDKMTGGVLEAEGTSYAPPEPVWNDSSDEVYVLAKNNRIWAASAGRGRLELLSGGDQGHKRLFISRRTDGRSIGTVDGGKQMVVGFQHVATGREGFEVIDLENGTSKTIFLDDISLKYDTFTAGDDRLVLGAQSAVRSMDYYSVSVSDAALSGRGVAGSADLERITSINPALDRYKFGKSRLIEFVNDDGKKLRATLLLPSDFQEGKPYPTVVWVYATRIGSEDLNKFGIWGSTFNMQMLATRGYAVLYPDIPVALGSPMTAIMKAVMPAINAAVATGVVDPDRLGVMGQSNGGYSTLALLVQSRRFKAGVANAGIVDLVGYHATDWSFLEIREGAIGAAPWEAPYRYVANSPVFHLDKISAPLLIQVGTEDKTMVMQNDQLFSELRHLKKEAIYLKYAGEPHSLTDPDNIEDYWSRVVSFLDEKVKNAAPIDP